MIYLWFDDLTVSKRVCLVSKEVLDTKEKQKYFQLLN